jgi:hypothetical protein
MLDENGDVNGNTLFTDNSNRDAIELAGGNDIARRKRGGGNNKKRGNGQNGKRANGNGKGNQRQAQGKGGQKGGGNKRRRTGQAGRGSPPSLLGN